MKRVAALGIVVRDVMGSGREGFRLYWWASTKSIRNDRGSFTSKPFF